MRGLATPLALALAIAATAACDAFKTSGTGARTGSGAVAPATPARLELRDTPDRPRLGLVAREGDPSAAVAVAVAHDDGSIASTALAAIVESRLAAGGVRRLSSRPHELGYQIRALITTPEEAARFVAESNRALLAPITIGEKGLELAKRRLEALGARTFAGAAEAAAARCVGELGVSVGTRMLDPTAPPGIGKLEHWRRRAHELGSISFGALGPAPILNATVAALDRSRGWPAGSGSRDPWPGADTIGVVTQADGKTRLAVAVRLGDPAAAVQSAQSLASDDAPLGRLLAVHEPPWEIGRVVAATRPRGACVRVDVEGPDQAQTAKTVARVAALIEKEVETSVARSRATAWDLEDGVLRTTDPRGAAAAAAWRALSGTREAGAPRTVVSYQAPNAESARRAEARLPARMADARRHLGQAGLETRRRVEAGQGELWMLVASPCGTTVESDQDAGLLGLAMRTAARRESGGVTLEPWVTPDAIGLLAHAPREGPGETPEAHARRVGAAVGRALTSRIGGPDFARARAAVVSEIGPKPEPSYWLALGTLADKHPSWLEPRGTFRTVTDATPQAAEQQRRALVGGPLRLAVLTTSDAAQATAATDAVSRWVRPFQNDQTCPTTELPPTRAGALTVETHDQESFRARAIVAAPWPTRAGGPTREAHWTVWLLNRPGGWLDRALAKPGLVSGAHARLLGGSRAAALLIELNADDGKLEEAVAQVRGLLARLAKGGATRRDADGARKRFRILEGEANLDPRRRVLDLWFGGDRREQPDIASLRRYHARAFQPDAHLVVYVKPRE